MSIKKAFAATLSAGLILSLIPTVSMADSVGWHKDPDGFWKYYTYEDGYVREDWKKIGGVWYYFAYSGAMISGVENYSIDGREYDFDSSGKCLNPGGRTHTRSGWYKRCMLRYVEYYKPDTEEYEWKQEYVDNWYYYGSDSKPVFGWKSIGGKWYYFYEYSDIPGAMYTGLFYDYSDYSSVKKYIFDEGGAMQRGWIPYEDEWYYAGSDGVLLQSEWLTKGGKTYYFRSDGVMVSDVDSYRIDDKDYSFAKDGSCKNPDGETRTLTPGWNKFYDGWASYLWKYLDQDLNPVKGWKQIAGKWYYFSVYDGYMYTGKGYIDDYYYYFKDSGEMIRGWYNTAYGWVYAGSDGVLYSNRWLNDDGRWYYFDSDGYMLKDLDNCEIDGIDYSFDSRGVCKNPYATSNTRKGWYYQAFDFHNNFWVYYGDDGELYKEKWLKDNGKWYYFDRYGFMLYDTVERIDGMYYDFDSNGVCLNPYNPREKDNFYVS